MKINHMAVVVSLDGQAFDQTHVRQEVWGTVTDLLIPGLGKLYEKFYPGTRAWGLSFEEPFGVILGSETPNRFLRLYHAACQAQEDAILHHIGALIRTVDPGSVQKIGASMVCPVIVDGNDQEQTAHMAWHYFLQKGAPLPDCGVYYVSQRRATASHGDKQAVQDHPERYAICIVDLELMEKTR